MHAHDTAAEPAVAPERGRRGRKIRAILAGGLVLGIGAAVTLAVWSDSEFATGTFTAGTFNLQGSTTSATAGFTDHPTSATAAPLTFTTPLAGNLSPNSTVYAPFWVRLAANTTSPATLDLTTLATTEAGGTANAANLGYSVYAIAPAAACDATATTGTLLGTGTTLASNASVAGGTVPLTIGTPVTAAGTAVQLCFVVTSGATLNQTTTTTATWQFVATSTAP
ncbi:hypothetical protein GCM10009846_19700 [Agrococcus versicolor]|uniref:Acyl-CoA dehydrogenase n=1 Tax=Agrococcus versicolor TaxID=501482 RepID=A0ABP5MND6_9MICO